MNDYLVTVPVTLTEEQRAAAEAAGWKIAADLKADVMAAAVPTTTLDISGDSPEQAAAAAAEAFGLDVDEVRVEERDPA
jgi:hypothetical protein